MKSEREKLPKTMSYPVKTSAVQDVLAAVGMDIPALRKWLGGLLALPARSPRRQAEQYFRQEWASSESPRR